MVDTSKIIKQKILELDEFNCVLLKEDICKVNRFVIESEWFYTFEELEQHFIPQRDNIDIQKILRPFI